MVFLATTPHILGNVVGNWLYFLASIYGLLWIAEQMGEAFLIVKLLGGAYLVYLGVKLWRSDGEISTISKRRPKKLLAKLSHRTDDHTQQSKSHTVLPRDLACDIGFENDLIYGALAARLDQWPRRHGDYRQLFSTRCKSQKMVHKPQTL